MKNYISFIFDSEKAASELSMLLKDFFEGKDVHIVLHEKAWGGGPNRYIFKSSQNIESEYVKKIAYAARMLEGVSSVMLISQDGEITPLDPIDTSDTPVISLDKTCPRPPHP